MAISFCLQTSVLLRLEAIHLRRENVPRRQEQEKAVAAEHPKMFGHVGLLVKRARRLGRLTLQPTPLNRENTSSFRSAFAHMPTHLLRIILSEQPNTT
jgi:hypothetical protein